METILKFITNTQGGDSSPNFVISRTMLKIAVISKYVLEKASREQLPRHGELWRCQIVRETRAGQNSGCIIVEPIERIDENDIVKLMYGTYTTKLIDKKLIVRPMPEHRGSNWVMPLHHKKMLAEEYKAYCLIVDLSEEEVDTSADHDGPKVYT